MNHHNQEDGFKETREIGPVLEVTTSFQYGRHGIEIRIWSVGQDNSHSWVRISDGTNKYVVDSNHNNIEIPCTSTWRASVTNRVWRLLQPDQRQNQNHKRERNCWITEHYSNEWKKVEWYWTISTLSLCVRVLEESDQSSSTLSNSTAGRMIEQFNSGEPSFIFGINFHKTNVGRMIVGKFAWQQEEVHKGDISIALIILEQFFTSVIFRDTLETILLILCYRTM